MKQPDYIVGIDPGRSGGIACYHDGKVEVTKMPESVDGFRDYLKQLDGSMIVFVERVGVRSDDVFLTNGRANLGKLYRVIKMIAEYEAMKAVMSAFDIPFAIVPPQQWQASLLLRRSAREDKAARERRYKQFATELYPFLKPTALGSSKYRQEIS